MADEKLVQFLFHMTPAGKEWLRRAAEIRGEPQARTLRSMVSFASRYMPTHWQPSEDSIDEPESEPDRAMGESSHGPTSLALMKANARGDRQ